MFDQNLNTCNNGLLAAFTRKKIKIPLIISYPFMGEGRKRTLSSPRRGLGLRGIYR
jgi:hypothetical protein